MNRKTAIRAGIGASALVLAVFSTTYVANAAPDSGNAQLTSKMSDSAARAKLASAGIGVSSSGGCSDRNNSNCTSLDQVNSTTIDGAVTLKNASTCDLTVTGGTETGHASGTYSHWNGYKLDFHMTDCLTSYVKGTFSSIGGGKWQSSGGNVYYDEGNHWDVTFHSCGCVKKDEG